MLDLLGEVTKDRGLASPLGDDGTLLAGGGTACLGPLASTRTPMVAAEMPVSCLFLRSATASESEDSDSLASSCWAWA